MTYDLFNLPLEIRRMIYDYIFCARFCLQEKDNVEEEIFYFPPATGTPEKLEANISAEKLEILGERNTDLWGVVGGKVIGSCTSDPNELGILKTSSAVRSEAIGSFYSKATFVFHTSVFRPGWRWYPTMGDLAKLSTVELYTGSNTCWIGLETEIHSRMLMVINSSSQNTASNRQLSVTLEEYSTLGFIIREINFIRRDKWFQALKKLTRHGLVAVKIRWLSWKAQIWEWDPERRLEEHRVYLDAGDVIQRELEPALGAASISVDSSELAVTFHPAKYAPPTHNEQQAGADQGGVMARGSA